MYDNMKKTEEIITVGEIWKALPNHEEAYEVSSRGRVRSLDRLSKNGRRLKGKILNQFFNNGYLTVKINSKPNTVHVLVAIAFHNHIPCGHKIVVDHIDNDNKLCNCKNNLQPITNRENTTKDANPKSGFTGVTKYGKKWGARILHNGKQKGLGLFKTPEAASEVFQKYKLENNLY